MTPHKLLTKGLKSSLPPLYTNEDIPAGNAEVIIKFFSPYNGWDWYITEGSARMYPPADQPQDPYMHSLADMDQKLSEGYTLDDIVFFGLVKGFDTELGYVSLKDINIHKGRLPLVERDLYWKPTQIKDLACCPAWISEETPPASPASTEPKCAECESGTLDTHAELWKCDGIHLCPDDRPAPEGITLDQLLLIILLTMARKDPT